MQAWSENDQNNLFYFDYEVAWGLSFGVQSIILKFFFDWTSIFWN